MFLVLGPCFLMQFFVSFLVFNHLAEEEGAGCFNLCSCDLVTIRSTRKSTLKEEKESSSLIDL